MDNREYFEVLANDLKAADLSPEQVKEALLYQITNEDEKKIIASVVEKKFAGWIPSGQIALPGKGYDFEADSSYESGVKRVNQRDEVDEEELAKQEEKREELAKLISETACLADKEGFTRHADFLDELLFHLL